MNVDVLVNKQMRINHRRRSTKTITSIHYAGNTILFQIQFNEKCWFLLKKTIGAVSNDLILYLLSNTV